ncbi:mucin-5AC isoform X1 [Neocloeon triangulifer]|uniref:mucin-5AC isoform X1 n=1 Tax=Neocloeon triangulifer TaxID=2078957 RepID=UPI00286F512D|nr:mucin-5AC isoform X1 [Neocloeon triangulifer]
MRRRGSTIAMPAAASTMFLVAVAAASIFGVGAQVYVNPDAPSSSSAAPSGADLVTQTVYGFLDFTTTIGNTVMVFSPQSAPAAPEPPKNTPAPKPIETKPPPTASPTAITPSKTVTAEKKPVEKKKVSSVVEVRVSSAVVTPPPPPPPPVVSSKVEVKESVSSKVEVRESTHVVVNAVPAQPIVSSVVEVRSSGGDSSDNLLSPPEVYDFQLTNPQFVNEESSRIYDLKGPSSKILKNLPISHRHVKPQQVGIITTKVDTVVRDGLTTVHETTVLGTVTNGKYSTIVQKTSTIKAEPEQHIIRPSNVQSILKTAVPVFAHHDQAHLEPTPAGAAYVEETAFSPDGEQELSTKPLRRSAVVAGRSDFLTRLHRSRSATFGDDEDDYDVDASPKFATTKRPSKSRVLQQVRPTSSARFANSRFGRTSSTSELATVSVFSGEPRTHSTASVGGPPTRFKSYRNRVATSARPNTITETPSYQRRGYKSSRASTGGQASQEERPSVFQAQSSAPLNKFKLNRPAGRWQYKTTVKPRVTIRQQNGPVKTNAVANSEQSLEEDNVNGLSASHAALTSPTPGNGIAEHRADDNGATEPSPELQAEGAEEHHVHEPAPAQETIRVEISTPADFSDVYFEIATIRSPYTFQVGTVKNTRFITVTSTIERSLVTPTESPEILPTEPLTENILATSTQSFEAANQLPVDASIATLPPIVLATNVETPPLETVTETFNTTQLMLKTHVLPVIQQGGVETKMYTLIQSYHITRFVTAVKTLPPSDAFQFLPSRALNEFNTRLDEAGSELHELEVSENDQDGEDEQRRLILPPDLDLAQIGGDFDLDRLPQRALTPALPSASTTPEPPTTPASPQLTPEQLQQYALLRYLNPLAPVPAITTSKPIVKKETIYESHVIPLFNGLSTVYTTISRPVSTVARTEYEVTTIAPTGLIQPQFTISSQPVVTQTMVTQTNSKVIKLQFGAKTVFTTLYQSTVVPTVLTTYITTQVPVQPTAAPFPGFFPGGFPGFPFVG